MMTASRLSPASSSNTRDGSLCFSLSHSHEISFSGVVHGISKTRRINELARLAKERFLTEEELAERDVLRKEYIAEWRRGAEQVLENTYIITPDGTKRELQKKQ